MYFLDFPREVCPEALDALSASDPMAIKSRRDLRRIHRFMATRTIMLRAFQRAFTTSRPKHILELGAGDGTLMLGLARRMHPIWPGVRVTLLDKQNVVSSQTAGAFRAVGWEVEAVVDDVMSWVQRPFSDEPDLIIANLFLHHFEAHDLSQILQAIAERSNTVFICEPRRAWLPLIGSRLIGFIGANAVTRGDAILSVRAGFRGQELSALWPKGPWRLNEYSAGLFSHCLLATRE